MKWPCVSSLQYWRCQSTEYNCNIFCTRTKSYWFSCEEYNFLLRFCRCEVSAITCYILKIHFLPSDPSPIRVNLNKLYVWKDVWNPGTTSTEITLNKHTTVQSPEYQVTNLTSSLYTLLNWSFMHMIIKQSDNQSFRTWEKVGKP